MKKLLCLPAVVILLITLLPSVNAANDPIAVSLSEQWAKITYTQPENRRIQSYKKLYEEVRALEAQHPNNEEVLSWAGIITASYAGAKGGLGGLKLAKQARDYLQAAIDINPEVLHGGARTSLGVLYYQVPPWPVGFGNVNRAEKLLSESYQKHSSNMDVLFFYADFLHRQKRIEAARSILQKARSLPARPGRELLDSGRQRQIERKLAIIDGVSS